MHATVSMDTQEILSNMLNSELFKCAVGEDVRLSKAGSILYGLALTPLVRMIVLLKNTIPPRERGPVHPLCLNEEQSLMMGAREAHQANKRPRPEFSRRYRGFSRKGFEQGWAACMKRVAGKLSEVLMPLEHAHLRVIMDQIPGGEQEAGPVCVKDVVEKFVSEHVGECCAEDIPDEYKEPTDS